MPHAAVVKIFATTQEPDEISPWQSMPPEESTGSGVVVGPGLVLTGAHVIADATFLQVQKREDPAKWVAAIEVVSHDADLALLRVEQTEFMAEMEPMEIGGLPDLRDRVSVVGYPIGGEEISITEGVVSRIEVQRYSHSGRALPAVTVDAAINDGNSGGPVLHEGRIVGIAFQALEDAENIGEMVPAPMLSHFLKGYRLGRSPLVPGLGIRVQTLENPVLRRSLRLRDEQGGVLVRAAHFGNTGSALRSGDVLLALGGYAIAHNGTIRYRDRYRMNLEAVLAQHFVGDDLSATLWRDGQEQQVELCLEPFRPLVPRHRFDRPPTWFTFAGLVFQVLDRNYLCTWDKWEQAPKGLLYEYYYGQRTDDRREVIVLSQVLADAVNVGYQRQRWQWVSSVNGVAPRDMAEFVSLVDRCDDQLRLETSAGGLMVFDAVSAREASAAIRARYRIPTDRSADLASPPFRPGL